MKIKVALNQLILETKFTDDEWVKVAKMYPEALKLEDGNGDISFIVRKCSNSPVGTLTRIGAVLNATSMDGKAAISMPLPALSEANSPEDYKSYIIANFSGALAAFEEIENNVSKALLKIAETTETLTNKIEVIV